MVRLLVAVPKIKELIDSISANTNRKTLEIADIGSGGGCPGIPLAIAFPQQNFTLVERMEKRCDFLQTVVTKIQLNNVKIECTTADSVKPNSFDIEVFRAFHPFDEKIIAEMDGIKSVVKNYDKIKMTVPFLEDHERTLL